MADMGRNTKEYPLCDPWHGEEGPRYLRTFLPAFISGLGTRGDKYGTLRSPFVQPASPLPAPYDAAA